ncbi:MAG: M48 family metallopeptidase [Desulfuromonadales bacterium]|nr:M48 family metallopeptidase [Desulfuromonadales bacterium]
MNRIIAVIKSFLVGLCLISMAGCLAVDGSYPIPAPVPSTTPQPTGQQTGAAVTPAQAERLKRLMLPLLHVMDRPIPSGQARISVVDDPSINAGSAGKGQFIVTTGLLNRANDVQLEAILAHEIAHDDLGHVAKAQTLGAGMDIASVLLDQIFPGSGQIAPIVGNLAIRAYGRQDEYEADSHGVKILRRLHPNGKEMMVSTLTWLEQASGSSGGGFFSTHPTTGDRVERLRSMP